MSTTHHVILTEQNVWFFALKNIKYYFFPYMEQHILGCQLLKKKKKIVEESAVV